MTKLTTIFAVLIFVSTSLFIGCGGNNMAYDYQEYNDPCYPNQQPNYVDGDYYIFNCGGAYRRVRRNRILYVQNPVFIPVLTGNDRDNVYRSMPRTSGVTRSTSVGSTSSTSTTSTTSPSTTGSGVTRSTSSTSSTSPTRSTTTRSTSSTSSRSTSGVSRSTSGRK